ncbi:MAG: hypothetical protein CMO29_06365 [Tistrella sp.]|nr:hypothetical protein [uncultured Tistrella sp.]MAM73412.1 hypothetical protein [Tistrella sp.]|tara:strand:+ start:308 stop:946 length:639 start_codon:yes stop_codon:yes gene_type:complete
MQRRLRNTLLAAVAAAASIYAHTADAQSLTPEQLRALVDKRVTALNPYQELLNDPDPARSLAAMQIMLESDDAELTRLALEFGLLSPNPSVKRAAFESFLKTRPIFSIRLDGRAVKDNDFTGVIRDRWNGNVTPEKIAYWRIGVGDYSPDKRCYVNANAGNECFVTVNADGIFLTASYLNARGIIGDDGAIAGSATLGAVDEPVPFAIKLLE